MPAFGRLVSRIMPATGITSPSGPGMMPDYASRDARCPVAESSAPGTWLDTICLVRKGAGMNEAVTERVGWSIRGGIGQDLRRLLRVAGLSAGPA